MFEKNCKIFHPGRLRYQQSAHSTDQSVPSVKSEVAYLFHLQSSTQFAHHENLNLIVITFDLPYP